MDPVFNLIYQEIVRVNRGETVPGSQEVERWNSSLIATRDAVDAAVSNLQDGYFLRPDGYLFLATNLHQMVAAPLSDPRSPVPFDAEVQAKLVDDVGRILSAARESVGSRRDIPASHVLRATAKVLDTLHLKSWRIWERE